MSEAAFFGDEDPIARLRRQMHEDDEYAARMRARAEQQQRRVDREWPVRGYVVTSVVMTAVVILGSATLFAFLAKACR